MHGARNFCCCQADPGLNYAEQFVYKALATEQSKTLATIQSYCQPSFCALFYVIITNHMVMPVYSGALDWVYGFEDILWQSLHQLCDK